ncbi:MAG: peptidoglycan-binding protein [Bacteroidota bacterium]
MSTIRILLGILCLVAIGCGTEPGSGVLEQSNSSLRGTKQSAIQILKGDCFVLRNDAFRERILAVASSQIGVREATGNNDGPQVEAYLKVTNLPKGNPWCAAFVSWVFRQAGFALPRTAWSPALFPLARQTLSPKPADVLGIYSIRLKRIAHAGLVEQRQNNWIISIEGNTNVDGSREGDGVYRKRRHVKTIAKFADWVR